MRKIINNKWQRMIRMINRMRIMKALNLSRIILLELINQHLNFTWLWKLKENTFKRLLSYFLEFHIMVYLHW